MIAVPAASPANVVITPLKSKAAAVQGAPLAVIRAARPSPERKRAAVVTTAPTPAPIAALTRMS
jgi:hypothetical protein